MPATRLPHACLLVLLLVTLAGCGGSGPGAQPATTAPVPQEPAASEVNAKPSTSVADLRPPADAVRNPVKLSFKVVVPDDLDAVDLATLRAELVHRDPEVRLTAVDELIDAGALSTDELRLLLRDDASIVREAAIETLARDARRNMDLLSSVLDDPDPDLREIALLMVTEEAGADAVGLLEQATADPSESVRQTARDLLCQLNPVRCDGDW